MKFPPPEKLSSDVHTRALHYNPMRYLTKTTLHARLESSREVVIYIPPREVIETTSKQGDLVVRFEWRGQALSADESDVRSTAVPAT